METIQSTHLTSSDDSKVVKQWTFPWQLVDGLTAMLSVRMINQDFISSVKVIKNGGRSLTFN